MREAGRPPAPPAAAMPDPAAAPDLPAGTDAGAVFRALFDAYPDSLLLVDAAGRIALANPSAATLLGYEADELTGLSVEELVPEAVRRQHAAYRAGYAHAPRTRPMGTQMDLVARRKDGSEVMVEIALSPLQVQGQALVVAAIRGIGSYPRVQQALRRARYSEHLAQLGRLALDARDAQQVLDHVSAIAAQALQVELAQVYLLEGDRAAFRVASGVGLLPGEEIGARVPNRPDTPPGFVLAQGAPVSVADYRQEQRYQVPPSYLAAGLVSALAVPLTERGRVVGVLTARARAPLRFGEDERHFMASLANLLAARLQRARTEEQLNHSQRLESVGQLTGGIAHDFNNLLTVIQGNLQVLQEWPTLTADPMVKPMLASAMRATRRAAELTGKLLAFSRRQMLQPSTVDLQLLLNSLADMLRRTLDQRIRIEVRVAPDCPPVVADPGQLESSLLNIAINARDAMPEGGVLRFEAMPCDALPPEVQRELDDPSAAPGRFVALSVADSGTGMPEAVKERAFEPFFTTKGAGRGTGLGLSTVYGFVKQSRGAVAIDSRAGSGTTVRLYLPRPWEEAAEETDDATGHAAIPPGLRVLLTEDDAEVRAVTLRFLKALGCRVEVAASGEQALLLLTPGAAFDLLLTDIALGAGMRGTELARQAQQRLPALRVLLMSGYSAELLQADREAPPAWELLRKPFSRDELAQAISRVVVNPAAGG